MKMERAKKDIPYEYEKTGFFAQVTGKMETLCEEELIELGATETKTT